MANIFLASDHHFNHANILKFVNYDGTPVRPGFSGTREMDERMIENHNSVVGVSDKVYFLGDVFMGASDSYIEKVMSRMNGKKRLIAGNHDKLHNYALTRHFEKVMLWRVFREFNFIASHVPLHASSLNEKKFHYNVHGHTHNNLVKIGKTQVPDPQYINVCMERINYTPVNIEEIAKQTK